MQPMKPQNVSSRFEQSYRPPRPGIWTGRIDDHHDRLAMRWHQIVQCFNLSQGVPQRPSTAETVFCFIGFAVDEGVLLNQGREGARLGPDEIRRGICNFPIHFSEDTLLWDLGDIHCPDQNLAVAQEALAELVALVLSLGGFPIVLGGGHELALGTWSGLRQALRQGGSPHIPATINFDAHLDLRPGHLGPSSGTMFRQIAERLKSEGQDYAYTCIGAQRSANTPSLFSYAESIGARVVLARSLKTEGLGEAQAVLARIMERQAPFHITICCDVFAAAHAPGVSAPQPLGLDPETVLTLLRPLFASPHLMVFDLAEVSPRFDADHLTARLAGILIFSLINTRTGSG